MATDRFFYIHAPSCGGTTLWSILRTGFGPGKFKRVPSGEGALVPYCDGVSGNEANAAIPMLGGHFGLAYAKKYLPERTFFSLVRNPLDRAVSAFARNVRNEKRKVTGSYAEAFLKFERRLAPLGKIGWLLSDQERAGDDQKVTPAMLDDLKASLPVNFGLIGVAERYTESLFLMKDLFGWDEVPLYDRRNVGAGAKKPELITPETRAKWMEMRHMEMDIYNHAVALFDAKWAAFRTPEIDAQVAVYEAALKEREQKLLEEHGGQTPFLKT